MHFLEQTSSVAELVRELVLRAQSVPTESPLRERCTVAPTTLARLLTAVPRIRSLQVVRFVIDWHVVLPSTHLPIRIHRLTLENLQPPASHADDQQSNFVRNCISYTTILSLFNAIDTLVVDRTLLFPATRPFPIVPDSEETIRQWMSAVPRPHNVPQSQSFVVTQGIRERGVFVVHLIHHLGILRSLQTLRVEGRSSITPRDLALVLDQSKNTIVDLTVNVHGYGGQGDDSGRKFIGSIQPLLPI